MKDQLVECKRCQGNACYEQHIDENTTTWLCMGCGFTTSTLMDKDGPTTRSTLETSPELYKDLMYVDKDNRAWFPATITLPAKGMVFIDGTDKADWKWSAVKAVYITPEERKTKNFPKDQTHKMDMKGATSYEQKDFMDALEVIGFYEIQN
jgi:hypothetical protein